MATGPRPKCPGCDKPLRVCYTQVGAKHQLVKTGYGYCDGCEKNYPI